MFDGNNGKIWTIILTGVFALAGTIVGGWLDAESKIELERTRLDSSVISLALSQKTETERQAFLEFLVATNLIKDPETKTGLKTYFEGPNAKSPPFIALQTKIPLTARTPENSQNTDIDFFICEKDIKNKQIVKLVQNSHASIASKGDFGESIYKAWGGTLYEEVTEQELQGKITVIVDFNHPEYAEREKIEQRLTMVSNQFPVTFMNNRGHVSPWRVSVVFCGK